MIQHPRIGIRPTIDGRRQGVRESLEVQTMNMAKSVADLISSTLKYPDGEPVECVISPSTIGRVPEAAASHELFKKSNVCATITVTPCWCYGSETMDMSPDIPHAIWGFNGTERPGAVYLAAVLASHAQKGIPAFGIYGRDVQEASDTDIPEDVKEKLLRYARAALATGLMRDTAYLSMGSVSMGIGGSIVNPDFFQEYLGMRNESVDMTEFTRRIDRGIYDPEEFERAMVWVKEHIKEGVDRNREDLILSKEEKEKQWEFVVKMFMIGRDLMQGNPRLAELGFEEEAVGHHALVAGFQGQRQWTDHFPNGDFMETFLNTQFDWNGIRKPFVFATENDSLNGVSMLFNYLLTNTPQIFADVRTYWSPEAVERVTGYTLEGRAADGFLHLINSGSCTLDGTGQATRDGKPVIDGDFAIDGVPGTGARITLYFLEPGGSKTGKLLPTGNVQDTITLSDGRTIQVSLVDAANPAVFVKATDLGYEGTELPAFTETDGGVLLNTLEDIRTTAAVMMGFAPSKEAASPAVPKVCMVSAPQTYVASDGRTIKGNSIDIVARTKALAVMHKAYAVTGGICTATAALITGTVANEVVSERAKETNQVTLAHPSGKFDFEICLTKDKGWHVEKAGVARTARPIMKGIAYVKGE